MQGSDSKHFISANLFGTDFLLSGTEPGFRDVSLKYTEGILKVYWRQELSPFSSQKEMECVLPYSRNNPLINQSRHGPYWHGWQRRQIVLPAPPFSLSLWHSEQSRLHSETLAMVQWFLFYGCFICCISVPKPWSHPETRDGDPTPQNTHNL